MPGLSSLIQGLENGPALTVMNRYDQALAYVWGRQDAGEGERDTFLSERFAYAYAMHVRAYIMGESSSMTNLQDAWDQWNDTGTIV